MCAEDDWLKCWLCEHACRSHLACMQVTLANFDPRNARMIWVVFGVIWAIVLLTLLYSWIERRAYDFRQEVSLPACKQSMFASRVCLQALLEAAPVV